MKKVFYWAVCCFLASFVLAEEQPPFVTARFQGRLGNNFFQVATASALAWDNGAEPYFMGYRGSGEVGRAFFRFNLQETERTVETEWYERTYSYSPITYSPNMRLAGYYQSEKYFAHHRKRLLKLLAPSSSDMEYMVHRYSWLIDNPNTVGVQIRYYKGEDPSGGMYPQYGRDYLEKAMALFPESSLFVVSSNDLSYAKQNIPPDKMNVVFLEGEVPYIDLLLLSFCKHNIISNSSFGWWAAWLNQNPHKKVIYPWPLFPTLPSQDYCPTEWISVTAQSDN